jgi:hypothetical protein
MTVLDGVDVHVIKVTLKTDFILDLVLPETSLPDLSFLFSPPGSPYDFALFDGP